MIEVRGSPNGTARRPPSADLSFDVMPGRVTGFLGPNGAGKTTTMRLILGLAYPDAGTARIDGKPYAEPGLPHARGGRAARRQGGARRPVRPTTTCSAWPRPTTCPGGGSGRCSSWSA